MSEGDCNPGPSPSLVTPTFSCYMRANPFSREKAEYLKAHQRRMKEFGPRPYMVGDYPELPRHYPGVRVVYQWDQIDAVTERLYYIPQRWTYHRDPPTLPTAKARREPPAKDIARAASATLRGVVPYSELHRRAASQSPSRSPGSRRPPTGSAVSRTGSQGTTLTGQTRGRRQRPRTCLPRARTPQPGEEQPIVKLTPLLPRKPPTGITSRSQTPSSIYSDQAVDKSNLDSSFERSLTRNSNHIQQSSEKNSRPVTATTSSASRRTRSLSRPATAVSRRTRWSDVADDAQSLNSSILELLQTISATDGKLKPLSPRADRMRGDRKASPGSDSSGYLNDDDKPNPRIDSATSDKVLNSIPNFGKTGFDSQTYGSPVFAQDLSGSLTLSQSTRQDCQKHSQKAKEDHDNKPGSWNAPGSSFLAPEQTDVKPNIDETLATDSASIDLGKYQNNRKSSPKANSVIVAHCKCTKGHESKHEYNNLMSESVSPQKPQALEMESKPAFVHHEISKENQLPTIQSKSNGLKLSTKYLEENKEEDTNMEHPTLANVDHETETSSDSSGGKRSPKPIGTLDIPLLPSPTSSEGSSSQAEYLLVSGSSTETKSRPQSHKDQGSEQTQPQLVDETHLRGEDSD
ncbi:hypothetical protein EGW08_012033 [Elysia chlorotica]|uniref:Uncharacterized protein n=1 Tax=Elysia chlorotica TaxID=188477 RepID=A0A433TF59_ELYCH|nr:hypothetical protein EGW08_012033 [Elysia chlorotica]